MLCGGSYLPANNFSNFALTLAAMYKGEKQKVIQQTFQRLFDLIQGKMEADLFGEVDKRKRTLAEAIYEVLNIVYDGRNGSNVLGGNTQTSQSRRQGSNTDTPTGERSTKQTTATEHTGRTESISGQREDVGTTEAPQEIKSVGEKIAEAENDTDTNPTEKQENVKEPKKVNIESLFNALNKNGEAKLSDHIENAKDTTPRDNRLVTDERYAELRERMRKKLGGQMNIGIDPEILAIGTEMAVYHLEKGARKFADYATAMIADLGDYTSLPQSVLQWSERTSRSY